MGSCAADQTVDSKDALMREKDTCKGALLCSSSIDRKNHAVQRLIIRFRKVIMNKSTLNSCSAQSVTSGKLFFSEVDLRRYPTNHYDLS